MAVPRKYTIDFINRAEALNRSGKSLKEIAEAIGGTPDHISKFLRAKGLDTMVGKRKPAHNRKKIPKKAVTEFIGGASVNALSKKYGVNRFTITRRLLEAGVQGRNKSESALLRMSRSTREQRKNLVKAAHESLRGAVVIRQKRFKKINPLKKAVGRCQIGLGEPEFNALLKRRRIKSVWQAPIDRYNVDFTVGSIAVELILHSRSFTYSKYLGERMKKIFDAGLNPVLVCFKNRQAFLRNMENVLTEIQKPRLDPSTVRQYRVIRCYVTPCPPTKDQLQNIPTVFSSENSFITVETVNFT